MAARLGVLLTGSSWLFGHGVDVMGNGGNSHTYWQCVELPQMRLYPSLGWPRVYAAGNGGAAYIPEGSPGLVRHNPGEGYVPVPGDLIIENPTAHNAYGHVTVVDRVLGNEIFAVEQNGSSTGRHTYTLNGSLYAGGYGTVKAVLHAPQNHFTNAENGSFSDGTFLRASDTGDVYEVVGGAPVYVTSLAAVGASGQKVISVPRWQLTAMRPYPSDGTFVRALPSQRVYRFAGGAPLYIAGWSGVGGEAPTQPVEDSVIAKAGGASPFDHILAVPADGTFVTVSSTRRTYVIVGGAPLFVSSWDRVGGPQPTVVIDASELTTPTHLRAVPTGASFVRALPSGQVYTLRAGHPFPVTSWSAYDGPQPYLLVDDKAIATCDHLACSPLGVLESTGWGDDEVTVTGWATDPNATTDSLDVVLSFGAPLGVVGSRVVNAGVASVSRPDVVASHPSVVTAHGFQFTVALPTPSATPSIAQFAVKSAGPVSGPLASPAVWVYARNAPGTLGGTQLLGQGAVSAASAVVVTRTFDSVARRWGQQDS